MAHHVNFWFDPVCPWCYVTSRWVREVAEHRDLEVTWHSFSLFAKNEPEGPKADRYRMTHQLLRVVESVRAAEGDEPIGPLYADMGVMVHHDRRDDLEWVPERLAAHGLEEHASALDDPSWDEAIHKSMRHAIDLAGDDIGTPLVQFEEAGEVAFFGPVLTRAPQGPDALKLFDALIEVFEVGGEDFYELKRTRSQDPDFGDRPALHGQ